MLPYSLGASITSAISGIAVTKTKEYRIPIYSISTSFRFHPMSVTNVFFLRKSVGLCSRSEVVL